MAPAGSPTGVEPRGLVPVQIRLGLLGSLRLAPSLVAPADFLDDTPRDVRRLLRAAASSHVGTPLERLLFCSSFGSSTCTTSVGSRADTCAGTRDSDA